MAINRDKVLKEAEKLVQRGKIEQAIHEYEKILKTNPNDANTINRIGDLYGRVGEVEKAVELYERIADHFTKDGFIPKAIAILKKINRLAPQRLDVFERLAELYIQQGLMVEAKSQYQILAEWYAKNSDLEKAAAAHQRLIQLDPSNHVAHLRLADILMQQNQTEQALAVYDRLGRLLLERGRLDEAERLYRHALEQNPPTGTFLTPLCEALVEAGRAAVAREFLAAALQRSPDDENLQVLQIRLLLTFGEARQALNHARQLLESSQDNHDIRMLVGQALLKAGEAVEARDMLLPTARSLTDRGNQVAAQQMVQGLLKAMPQDQQVLRVAVAAFATSGETEMIFTLRAALADSLFRSGQASEAAQLYSQLLQEDPDNQMFTRRLAELGGSSAGELGVAIDTPRPSPTPKPAAAAGPSPSAAAAAPPASPFDPDERLAEAAVFAKYGLVDKAVSHLRDVLGVIPDHREARERLVTLFVEQGDTEKALGVASPLLEVYRSVGDFGAEESLRAMLPQLGDAPPQVAGGYDSVLVADEAVPVAEDLDDEVILIEFEDDEIGIAAELPAEEVQGPALAHGEFPAGDGRFDELSYPADNEITDSSITPPTPTVDGPAWEPSFEVSLSEPDEPSAGVADWERELREAARAMPERPVEHGALSELDAIERSLFGAGPVSAPRQASPVSLSSGVAAAPERAPRDEKAPERFVDESTAAQSVVFDFDGIPVEAPRTGTQVPVPAEPPRERASSVDELMDLSDSLVGPGPDNLDRFDFFVQQDLLDDALRELRRLEQEYPDDPEVAQRRLTLKSKGVLLESVSVEVAEASEDLFADEEDFFDLAKELEEELAEEEALVDEATGRGKDEALLEEVFREFQKGVAEQLSEEDSDTHFNLGIAYKEMGLLPEAIREFQISSRDPQFFVESCSMIGVCYLEQGMADRAAEWYQKALVAPDLSAASRIALRYDLAGSLELAGEVGQAYDLFSEIYTADPAFRDVADRLIYLEEQRQAN